MNDTETLYSNVKDLEMYPRVQINLTSASQIFYNISYNNVINNLNVYSHFI